MVLFSLQDIKRGLDKEFIPLEPMLTGLRLVEGGLSNAALDAFERNINHLLPAEFRDAIKEYDFGKLTIGPVVFCNTGDYLDELTKLNTDLGWWGDGVRPTDLLMVANSDPFAILLNLRSGEVLSMDFEQGWRSARSIARSFDLFIKGVGTTMLKRNETADPIALGCNISSATGSSDQSYWIQLAK